MKILLSNDDGWNAAGIQTLYHRLLKEGHQAEICAPDRNRSGVSNCFTPSGKLQIEQQDENIFSCTGFPADCVMAALRGGFLPFVPDVVMTGINHGANMGTDLIYSGTAAAARQAVLYGFPGVAFSVDDPEWKNFKFDALADFAAKNVAELAKLSVPGTNETGGVFVNVNALSADSYKGIRFASSLAYRDYHDIFSVLEHADGIKSSSMKGGEIVSYGGDESDVILCRQGFVSVSCVYADPFCQTEKDISKLVL